MSKIICDRPRCVAEVPKQGDLCVSCLDKLIVLADDVELLVRHDLIDFSRLGLVVVPKEANPKPV